MSGEEFTDDPMLLALEYVKAGDFKAAQDMLAGQDRTARRVFRQTLRLAARLDRRKDWPAVFRWFDEEVPEDDGRWPG